MNSSERRYRLALGGTAAAALVYLFAFKPLFSAKGGGSTAIGWLTGTWVEKNQLQHCWLIPVVILFLVWRKRQRLRAAPVAPKGWGLGLVGFGLLLYLVSIRTLQPRIAVFSLPFIVVGAAVYLHGWRLARHLVFPAALVLLTIPVPGTVQATNSLQLAATERAHHIVSAFGVEAVRTGNLIQSADSRWGFDVAEGCSGIRSLLVLMAGTAIYGHLVLRSLVAQGFLFALSIPVAVVANCLRIASVILIAEFGSAEFAGNLYHDYSTWIFFGIGFSCIVLAAKLLGRRRVTIRRQAGPTKLKDATTTAHS